MSAEENMALARRFMEAKIKGDLDAMDAVMAPDYVTHTKSASRPRTRPGTAHVDAATSFQICVSGDHTLIPMRKILLSAASAVSDRHLNSFERAIAWAQAADPESRWSLEGWKLQRCLEVAPSLSPVIG